MGNVADTIYANVTSVAYSYIIRYGNLSKLQKL